MNEKPKTKMETQKRSRVQDTFLTLKGALNDKEYLKIQEMLIRNQKKILNEHLYDDQYE